MGDQGAGHDGVGASLPGDDALQHRLGEAVGDGDDSVLSRKLQQPVA